jgi:hypothetical protein
MKMKLIALALCAAAPLAAQSGGAFAARIRVGASDQWVAQTSLPTNGDAGTAESSGALVAGKLATGLAATVASGASSPGLMGAQSLANVMDVKILNGVISASRVIAVSVLSRKDDQTVTDAEGSEISGLTVLGVPVGSPAPGTRVTLPGVGYVIFNERVSSGTSLTVNMIHVYLTNLLGVPTGEIIVGSATCSTGT